MNRRSIRGCLIAAAIALVLVPAVFVLVPIVFAEPSQPSDNVRSPAGFLPVWKLLSRQEKLQFVAGYIQGWKDAATVTDIAITFVRDNPNQAVEGLEKIKRLYDLSYLKPDAVVSDIDKFYADPDNCDAPLSKAISASR